MKKSETVMVSVQSGRFGNCRECGATIGGGEEGYCEVEYEGRDIYTIKPMLCKRCGGARRGAVGRDNILL